MAALRIWNDILAWRWTPAVALSVGALLYIGLAVEIIPEHIGDATETAPRARNTLERLPSGNSTFATRIGPRASEPRVTETVEASRPAPILPAPAIRAVPGGVFPRRGFSPPLPRSEPPQAAPPAIVPPPPPVAPPPPPPAAEPPAPATATPAAPNANPNAPAPAPAPGDAAPAPDNAPANGTPTPPPEP